MLGLDNISCYLSSNNFKQDFIHIKMLYLVSDDQNFIEQDPVPRYPQTLFEHGFFEIVVRLPNRIIKANCLTCQRLGRANLIQAREYSSSNLLGHLKVSFLNIHELNKRILFK